MDAEAYLSRLAPFSERNARLRDIRYVPRLGRAARVRCDVFHWNISAHSLWMHVNANWIDLVIETIHLHGDSRRQHHHVVYSLHRPAIRRARLLLRIQSNPQFVGRAYLMRLSDGLRINRF